MKSELNLTQLAKENVTTLLARIKKNYTETPKPSLILPVGKDLERFLANKIDHTLLKSDATLEELNKLCQEADEYSFASVCVNPSYVSFCKAKLKNPNVKVCTVIGFPLGSNTTQVKKFEAEEGINNGAEELDMVINIGKLKSGDYEFVYKDILSIASLTKSKKLITKVIIETCLLTDEEKVKACLIAENAGADFVKTSTGFSKGGATIEDVYLMKFIVGDRLLVKASGGVRTREDAMKMIAAGADRIGTSSGVKIILDQYSSTNY